MPELEKPDIHAAAAAAGLRPPDDCVPFESRATHLPWFDRVDPFWLGFGANPSYNWQGPTEAEWFPVWHPYGPKWMSRWVTRTEPIEGRKWTSQGGRIERVAGLLISWHVLTSQQIAAMGGMDPSGVNRTLDAMMRAGLVERSKMVARYSTSSSMPFLWRLRLESREYQGWFKALTEEQRWALTLGVEGGSGGHERHDVVIAEVALRAIEVMPKLQAIFGERAAPAKLLLADQPKVRSRGDAVLVRDDGLRIILELTTQPTIPDVRRKMTQWARLLGERGGPSETGVVVIFLSGQYAGGGVEHLQRSYDRAITPEAIGGDNPAPPEVLLAARASIFVAHWQDWFPATWCISTGFASLEAFYSPSLGKFFPAKVGVAGPAGVPFRPTRDMDWQQPRRDRDKLPAIPRWIEGPIQWVAEQEDVS